MTVHVACRAEQLVEGRGRPVILDGRYLAVFLVDGRTRVIDNQCLHVGSPLDGGAVLDGDVICPWHGWRYDLATGARRTAFGDLHGLQVYESWIEDGAVMVRIGH
jgi:nitrite reductase/ring-hydroxylating ferredoxin subunit